MTRRIVVGTMRNVSGSKCVERGEPSQAIGIDMGGTTTRAGMVVGRDIVGPVRRVATSELGSFRGLIEWIVATMQALSAQTEASSTDVPVVNISVPGLLDKRRERVSHCINVPWLNDQPLERAVTEALGCRVALVTDSNAATWGEYVARPEHPSSFAHLRLGTGVAFGLVAGGALVDLDCGRTQHLETLIVDHSAEAQPCGCGLRGCLETVASGIALERSVRALGLGQSLQDLALADKKGAREANALLSETARRISMAIKNVRARWNPEVVTLGGGVIETIPALLERVVNPPDEPTRQGTASGPTSASISPPLLGDNAGVVGAALLAQT